MGKKCIPGVICIENMTLFVLVVIFVLIIYLYYQYTAQTRSGPGLGPSQIIIGQNPAQMGASMAAINPLVNLSARTDPFNNPYAPPLKSDMYNMGLPISVPISVPGIPVNVSTRGPVTAYEQVGILTRNSGSDLILPLMGRRTLNGRDKWSYYTISNTGSVNTKLPVSINGRSCMNDNGCDSINNGDRVYVGGYNDTFSVTVYDTGSMSYIPYL